MQALINNPIFWKMALDGLLFVSILYFAHRFLKSPQNSAQLRQVEELGATLKNLIKEAEATGNGLNDQLARRQQNLEKVLYDLEGSEQRIGKAIQEAEELRRAVDESLSRARSFERHPAAPAYDTPHYSEHRSAQPQYAAQQQYAAQPQYVEPRAVQAAARPAVVAEEPPVPAFEMARPETIQPRASAPRQPERKAKNIYGQDIDGPAAAPAQAKQPAAAPRKPEAAARSYQTQPAKPLARAIEREVEAPSKASEAALEEVYMQAEDLLKTGKDMEFVAARTRLPLEEVKMLSQLIVREQLEEQGRVAEQDEDPRLGVLTGFKRQVQTL